jgi:type IV conjugative transfer system coupling protein TraD
MIRQNANIIWVAGRIGFVVGYLVYLFFKYSPNLVWNYLCYVKAAVRVGIRSLPSRFFDGSYLRSNEGYWQYFSDYTITRDPDMLQFKTEFQDFLIHNLKVSTIFAVVVMIIVSVVHKRLGKSLKEKKEIFSGYNYVNGKELKRLIKEKSDITLANIPYPKGAEFRHTLVTGTTGSGKTNTIIELLDQVQARGDRAIIVDTVGTYINRYYNPERGDIILNPLEPRSVPWSFLEECKDDVLLRNVASCLIDRGGEYDRFWEEAAKIVFVETAKKVRDEKKSLEEFINILLKTSLPDIQKYLEGSYGASLMDKNADKMAISIRATLINAVHVFDALREEQGSNFSIKKWIETNRKGVLFLSCSPKERNTVIPMITAWLSIASDSLMQMPETNIKTWFFIDELHNLKKLPKLDLALAEIRKYGGCFVIGTQLIAQLEKTYGKDLTRAITGLCGTKIVMTVPEPITAKYMADFLGEKEEITSLEKISYGANTIRDGANIAQRYAKESVVSGSEIMNLTTGEAFIRFYGVPIVGKLMFKYHEK